ncbi:MAG: FixH family protein, partial [Alphaproteobacteria bacterium]
MNLRPADTKPTSPNRGVTGREITGRHVLIALLLFFGAVTAVNIFMIRAAVSTFGGVETRSSYRAGLGFADEQARVAEQDTRGWNVSADIAGRVDGRSIAVRVQDRNEAPIGDLAARAAFAHPVDSRLDL